MSDRDIEIEIDGKALKASPNSMVIQVADEAGIYIPRFCYHKLLSVAANCRMCLVEVEKAPKPLPACATPVVPGMKVWTRSQRALAAQRAVMEFLLINHPLDCPICDQGGECELQDLSMGYGRPKSSYREGKRAVKDEDLGPLIATDMTRCIQCTRCVRFGEEIAGFRELGAINRGEALEIGTYVQHALHSEVSGNIIDLCPVGALTSKPFRFTARAWELDQRPTIAPHDCVGTNLYAHVRNGRVMRVVPRENGPVQGPWISDRDRFSYEGLYHVDRLGAPRIRKEGQWQETDWETALEQVAFGLQKIVNTHGADQLAALTSPNATVEECYLLQKLMRAMGSNNIDHRLRQMDLHGAPPFANRGLPGPVIDLEESERIILLGSHIQKEQPRLALRVREATLKGADVFSFNMMDYRFHFRLAGKNISAPHQFLARLAAWVKALGGAPEGLAELQVTKEDLDWAGQFKGAKKTTVLLGALALNHPEAAEVRALACHLAECLGAKLHFLTEGANGVGAWLAGAVPHHPVAGATSGAPGLDACAVFQRPRKGYLLLNVEPDLDCAQPPLAIQALKAAECVVAFSLFRNPVLEDLAHVILPIAAFTETAGTFVNAEGHWQSFKGASAPHQQARPAWKILRVLANFLKLDGFQYASSEEVLHEVKMMQPEGLWPGQPIVKPIAFKPKPQPMLSRIGEVPIYSTDSLARHAPSLQATQKIIAGDLACVRLHPQTAAALGLKAGDTVRMVEDCTQQAWPLVLDPAVPLEGACIAAAQPCSAGLPELFGPLTLERAL